MAAVLSRPRYVRIIASLMLHGMQWKDYLKLAACSQHYYITSYVQGLSTTNTITQFHLSKPSIDIVLDSVGREYKKCASIDIDAWECVEHK